MANVQENRKAGDSSASYDYTKHARSAANPISTHGHRRPEQQCQGGVTRHGVILLRRRKCKKDEQESRPAKGQQSRSSCAVNRFVGKLREGGEIDAPGKEPQQVEQPEP